MIAAAASDLPAHSPGARQVRRGLLFLGQGTPITVMVAARGESRPDSDKIRPHSRRFVFTDTAFFGL